MLPLDANQRRKRSVSRPPAPAGREGVKVARDLTIFGFGIKHAKPGWTSSLTGITVEGFSPSAGSEVRQLLDDARTARRTRAPGPHSVTDQWSRTRDAWHARFHCANRGDPGAESHDLGNHVVGGRRRILPRSRWTISESSDARKRPSGLGRRCVELHAKRCAQVPLRQFL